MNNDRYNNMTDNEKILFNIVDELSLQIGEDSLEKPLSLSLYLWKMGADDPELKDKILAATLKLMTETKDLDTLVTTDFYKVYQPLSEIFADEESSQNMIRYIVTWIGLNVAPRLYPVAMNLEAKM